MYIFYATKLTSPTCKNYLSKSAETLSIIKNVSVSISFVQCCSLVYREKKKFTRRKHSLVSINYQLFEVAGIEEGEGHHEIFSRQHMGIK